ncbi:MAG: PRC-barrel domain-containing protein [Deltaproteobacteria bacterium]
MVRRDSEGRISFAVISGERFLGFGEKLVAIPYGTLTYDKEKQYLTTAVNKDQFANAPEFEDETKLHDLFFAVELCRYFALQPYWTEESTETSEWGY